LSNNVVVASAGLWVNGGLAALFVATVLRTGQYNAWIWKEFHPILRRVLLRGWAVRHWRVGNATTYHVQGAPADDFCLFELSFLSQHSIVVLQVGCVYTMDNKIQGAETSESASKSFLD
jgi:hypothetical protein